MTDTQWPKFEVFLQESEDATLEHAGAVHAPDSEMALLNARDVFVRRPHCTRLGVIASEQVFFRTSEQLRQDMDGAAGQDLSAIRDNPPSVTYLVFAKAGHRGSLKFADRLTAGSEEEALNLVIGRLGINRSGFWAAIAEASIIFTEPADAESLFAPAETKSYRLQSDYPVNKLMRELKK